MNSNLNHNKMKTDCRSVYKGAISVIVTVILITAIYSCSVLRIDNSKNQDYSGFAPNEVELIMAADSSLPMRVFKTDNQSDSLVLRSLSKDVLKDTSDIHLNRLIKRMYITVNDTASLGVGIAAPQVGVLKRVIWVQRFDKPGEPFEVYLNPRIVQYSQLKQERREGCLSVPDLRGDPKIRAYAILIEYNRPDMSFHREMVEGFTSIIFQHEIDHLNGILFTDYLK